jgi:tetratricopeptide (TPR) repeat protein
MKKIIFSLIMLLLMQSAHMAHQVYAEPSSEAVQNLTKKLETWDVAKIWPEVLEALAKQPQDPDLLEVASHIAFHRGDYPESLKLMKRSIEAGGVNEARQGFALFIEETINVLSSYKRYETPNFIITLDEKRDGIIVDYVTDALEKTYAIMAQHYGFVQEEKVRVEIFPDARSFYLASALSVRDIEETGAVGLTKFNKLQLLSPRALVQGYRWLDAISHEYMHYLIVKLTSNEAPIWFHEGLSKYEETRWRNGPSYLSPLYQTLLARAQVNDSLIGFDRMEPSLIHLETPDDVQLAYAQAASAIDFIIESIGHDGLKKIMESMVHSKSEGAGESIQEVMGMSFPEFEEKWAAYLGSKEFIPLAGATVHRFKVREGEMNREGMDLEEIKSLVARNRTHLGDKLKERGRPGAAVKEYQRALAETQDAVPIRNRLSSILINLNRHEEALEILNRTVELAPDHPTPYTQLGRIYLVRKDFEKAKGAFEESIQINPFDPDIHMGVANAYAMLGDQAGSAKERDIARKLIRRR